MIEDILGVYPFAEKVVSDDLELEFVSAHQGGINLA
jgi:hypothetical protein